MSEGELQQQNPLLVSRPVPALRLNQRDPERETTEEAQPEVAAGESDDSPAADITNEEDASSADIPGSAWDRWIRPVRALSGLTLLALAYSGLLLISWLVQAALQTSFTLLPLTLSLRPLLPVVYFVLALWIGIIALLAIFVGSFLLFLALRVPGW